MSADVISDNDGTHYVKMGYRESAKGYVIGFACALFMAASVAGFLMMWEQHLPESWYPISVSAFVVFSYAGFVSIAFAYAFPIRVYELLEGGVADE